MTTGYCVKCKAKQEMSVATEQTLKNGRKAIKGKCPACGTGMFKILSGKTAGKSNPQPTTHNPRPFRFTFFDQ